MESSEVIWQHSARLSDATGLGTCVVLLAGVALARQRASRAACLLGTADGLCGAVAGDFLPPHHAMYERVRSEVGRELDDPTCASLMAGGARLSQSEAVEFALSARDHPNSGHPFEELTRREQEVARLAARGLRNREIANALVITEGTARVHVEHVLAKLDLHSRAQLAAWAASHRVLEAEPET